MADLGVVSIVQVKNSTLIILCVIMTLGGTVWVSAFAVILRRRCFDLEAKQRAMDKGLLTMISTEVRCSPFVAPDVLLVYIRFVAGLHASVTRYPWHGEGPMGVARLSGTTQHTNRLSSGPHYCPFALSVHSMCMRYAAPSQLVRIIRGYRQ
jgi:hypothetical protein